MVLDAADPDTWSAGSFFTNPVLSRADFERLVARVAGGSVLTPCRRFPVDGPDGRAPQDERRLADRAGRLRRGFGLPGPAAISTKHTLALTNRGDATARDLLALAEQVRDGVESVRRAAGQRAGAGRLLALTGPLGCAAAVRWDRRMGAAAGEFFRTCWQQLLGAHSWPHTGTHARHTMLRSVTAFPSGAQDEPDPCR